MKTISRQIIVIGGGLLRLGETAKIDEYIVAQSFKKKPYVLFFPTGSNDLKAYTDVFKSAYRNLGCDVMSVNLIDGEWSDAKLKKELSKADIIYIGGGKLEFIFEYFDKFNLIQLLKDAYSKGCIMSGLSAGCAFWYQKFLEKDESKNWHLKTGIGVILGVAIPHFNKDDVFPLELIEQYKNVVAIENNCAVHYRDEKISNIISVGLASAFTISPKSGNIEKIDIAI